ncbi:hypothetical protein F0342_17770 [Bacillus sp. CH30_1T]|uniref:hypothetical protein n=1 Tax=Bacillus sp. CH30_1T TaxID=2604836 RepID=UPI0011EE57C3|nr:hypothetical protein [Bacillus sp. CH30_1T]KAA0562266.1 hypothetical protein F0342_17770 [Bacillus sp. CH30_1T]
MSRWSNLNQWMFDLDTFYPLYLWIVLNAMYVGGVQLGCVMLGERPYIRSIGKFRETLFYKVRMWPFCKWMEYGSVYTFKPMNDLACGHYFYWIGMSVKKGYDDSGIDQLDNKADSGLSSCGEKHVNRVRK